jgi:hypothetical protein
MPIGWFLNLAAADSYFTVERLSTSAWDAMADADKTKSIINAYNRIYYDPAYSVPTYAAATATQLVILSKANAEMAYYIAQHLADEDRRKGIQAQAVIKAGIVKEDYYADWLDKLPVPPFVDTLLDGFKTYQPFGMTAIDRDEDEDVDEDVTGL